METSRHPTRTLRQLSIAALASTALLALPRPAVHAGAPPPNNRVYNCNEGALRSVIANAPAGATVTFACSGTITLTAGGGGPITLNKNLAIDGSGQSVTISGGGNVQVFAVNAGATVTLNDLTIAGGSASSGYGGGGGIDNFGNLTVTNSNFSGNSANGSGGGIDNDCGGIDNACGTLTVSNSTFSGNSAAYGGGGIENVAGTVTVTDSTFSGNSASTIGGGIDAGGTLTVSNSTFSGNSAAYGGGIYSNGSLTVSNSTFSGNSAPGGAGGGIAANGASVANTILANSPTGGNCAGPITDQGGNVEDSTSCGFSAANHSLSNSNPQLLPLANNGGSTQTMALPLGSPAIGVGLATTCLSTGPAGVNNLDQRGQPRHADTRGVCDSGAFDTGGGILPTA